jgi:thiol-disulfide isomerase/thioredoxin
MPAARRTKRKAKIQKGKAGRRSQKGRRAQKVTTARGHIQSTAGRIFPPIDVRHPKDIKELIKRLSSGPMTVVLIYADWCPHCHDFMPHFDEASNQSGRTTQAVKIRDNMVEKVNEILKRMNKLEHTIEATGYPTVKAMSPEVVTPEVNNGKENLIIDIETKPELVMESMKIAEPNVANANFLFNGNMSAVNKVNKVKEPSKVKSKSKEKLGEADEMVALHDMTSRGSKPSNQAMNLGKGKENKGEESEGEGEESDGEESEGEESEGEESEGEESEGEENELKERAKGAEELGVTRPNQKRDMRPMNQIVPGVRGGSLIGAMSQTAYTLAPTAVLLATAKAMFNRKRATRKAKKSIRGLLRMATARR